MPFGKIGPLEFGLILLIVLMVFGVGKLPQVGASLGKFVQAFKQGASASDEDEETPKHKKRAKRKKTTKVTA